MPIQLVASACSSVPPPGSGRLRSKRPMLSRPRKPPSKTLRPRCPCGRFTHPVKFSINLMKIDSRKLRSARPVVRRSDLVHAVGGPGMHGRIHVAQLPLVGGNLAVRVHVPLAQQQDELVLRELRIDERERDAVESEIPGRVPGVFPLVGHREDFAIVEMPPLVIPARPALARRRGLSDVSAEPSLDVVPVVLLAPEQPRDGLAEDPALVGSERCGGDRPVEFVGFGDPRREDGLVVGEGPDRRARSSYSRRRTVTLSPGATVREKRRPHLGALASPTASGAADDRLVESVLHARPLVGRVPQTPRVRVVLGEEELVGALHVEEKAPEMRFFRLDDRHAVGSSRGDHLRAFGTRRPAPRVSETSCGSKTGGADPGPR